MIDFFGMDSRIEWPNLPRGLPADSAPYAAVLTKSLQGLDAALALRDMPSSLLRYLASDIVVRDIQLKATLGAWKLPVPEERFWFHLVLPRIEKELTRRDERQATWAVSQVTPSQMPGVVEGL